VTEALAYLLLCRVVPEHIRSGNGPEFATKNPVNDCSRFPDIHSISRPH
jgi:hypothetical protein